MNKFAIKTAFFFKSMRYPFEGGVECRFSKTTRDNRTFFFSRPFPLLVPKGESQKFQKFPENPIFLRAGGAETETENVFFYCAEAGNCEFFAQEPAAGAGKLRF